MSAAVVALSSTRGTSNRNERGSAETRRRRRAWLVETYRADCDLLVVTYVDGRVDEPDLFVIPAEQLLACSQVASVEPVPSCRCYRCGRLLTVDTVTVDRIVPGCKGGTYRRDNIRPACGPCNSETGGALRRTACARS